MFSASRRPTPVPRRAAPHSRHEHSALGAPAAQVQRNRQPHPPPGLTAGSLSMISIRLDPTAFDQYGAAG